MTEPEPASHAASQAALGSGHHERTANYRDHPFLQPSDQVNWLRRMLENQEVRAALRLK